MKQQFRLYRRGRGGRYYIHDGVTGKQESLGTHDRATALRLIHSRNEAQRQPAINLQIARAYLAVSDPEVAKRTWQDAMDEVLKLKRGCNFERWHIAIQDRAFNGLRKVVILETRAEHFLRALEQGGVSTNVYLRRIHNFALAMNWLPWPVIVKAQWPKVEYGKKRAITNKEHEAIVAREPNRETRAFYEMCWHLGGAQSDIAALRAEDVDWRLEMITYRRSKTGSTSIVRLGPQISELLRRLPQAGPLFPQIAVMHEKHCAKQFRRRCLGLGIEGVSLHSYRYAWAERAKCAGYPDRFAMEALGHNSSAIHRAYARNAQPQLPSLETYEAEVARLQPIVFQKD